MTISDQNYFPNPPLLERLRELLEYLDEDLFIFEREAAELRLTRDLTSFRNELDFWLQVVFFPLRLLMYDCVP